MRLVEITNLASVVGLTLAAVVNVNSYFFQNGLLARLKTPDAYTVLPSLLSMLTVIGPAVLSSMSGSEGVVGFGSQGQRNGSVRAVPFI